jgi:hypothetical protein
MVILLAHVFEWHFIPDATSVSADLNPLGPAATAVRPPSQLDLAIVDNLVVVDGRHDGARNRHGLNAETVAVGDVVLSHLRTVVNVLFHLYGSKTRLADDVDPVEPLAASRTNVTKDNHTEWIPVDLGERLAVHLPSEHYLVNFDFSRRNGNGIIVYLSFLEVCVGTEKFDMFTAVFKSTTVLEDFLETHTSPSRGSDRTFAPRRVDELVAIPRVLLNLLNTPGTGTLQGDCCSHAGKDRLVLEFFEGDLLWSIDETLDFNVKFFRVDFGDTSMVTYEMVCIGRDLSLDASVWSGFSMRFKHKLSLAYPALKLANDLQPSQVLQ